MTDTTGARLRSVRVHFGLSQVELARAAGLSDAYVSLIESGKRTASDKALTGLADVLQTTAAYLKDGEDSPVEAAVRAAIATAREQLAAGHAEDADHTLSQVRAEDISHLNRLNYLQTKGLVLDALGEIDTSITWFDRALTEARTSGTAHNIAEIGMWIVGGHRDAGALDAAVHAGEAVLAEVEALGIDGTDEHLRLAATLVWAVLQRGDHAYARYLIRHYVQIADEFGTARGRGSVYWNAALIELEVAGNDAEAVRLAETSLAAMLEAGSARDVPRLRYDYATILLGIAEPRPWDALVQLDLAEEELRRVGSRVEVARCQIERGRALVLLGQIDDAEDVTTRGLADLSATGTLNMDTCAGYMVLGDVAFRRGDVPLAQKRYGWAAERLSMMSAARYAAQVWADLGGRLRSVGREDACVAAYRNALTELSIRSDRSTVRAEPAQAQQWAAPVGGWVAA